MKKVLFSVLLIAMIASMVGAGTWAYFTDYEHSYDNTFTAGSLDLKVDGIDDPLPVYFEEVCLMPCDSGQVEITLMNDGCVPGMLDIKLYNLVDNENVIIEPEAPFDSSPEGELSQYMWMEMWADCTGGTNYDTLIIEGFVADLENDLRYFCDCIKDQEMVGLLITWEIDCEVGNQIMTDSIAFDIEFSLEQEPCMYDCWLDVTGFEQPASVVMPNSYDFDVLVHCDCDGAEGECSGTVNVEIKDALGATVWAGSQYIAALPYCETVPVSFSWTPTTAGSYTVVADGEECPFEVMEAGALVVTGIQQDDYIQICENLSVGVDVHNQGGVPTEGVLFACVVDPLGDPLIMPLGVPTGVIDPCQTVKIPVDFGHVGESWRPGGAVVAGFPENPMDPQEEELVICPMGFLLPATYEVVGIQQPSGVQPCENIDIAIDVHNTGDKPGVCDAVIAWIEDEGGVIVWGPEQASTGVMTPCIAEKVWFGPIHIEEAWLGQTVTVFAQACGGIPVTCDINILGGPCIVVTGIQQPEKVEPCDVLTVGIDVHNAGGKAGECFVDVWVEDELGALIAGPFNAPVPLLAPCDTEKIPVVLGHVDVTWPPIVYVVAVSCCGEPVSCPIEVITEIPTYTYYTDPETSFMVLASSILGAPLDPLDPPSPTPMQFWFDVQYSAKQTGSVYRDLTIPYTSWYSVPYSAQESVPQLNWVTITLDWSGTSDGDGKLYVETGGASPAPDNGDVDYHSEVTDDGIGGYNQVITWGDGTVDANGSAWVHIPLVATVWTAGVGPTDPCDPSTWGMAVLSVPLDLYMTTGEADNHITDAWQASYPGCALNCHWIPDCGPPPDGQIDYSPMCPLAGTPFAEDGGAILPYVGTSATIVGATGGTDLMAGFMEIDFQVELYLDISTTPWVDPCLP